MSSVVNFSDEPQKTKERDPVTDPIVCLCHSVHTSQIREAIDVSGARTSDEVSTLTRAGSACGACHCRIDRLIAGRPVHCGPCSFCSGCGYIMKFCSCQSAAS